MAAVHMNGNSGNSSPEVDFDCVQLKRTVLPNVLLVLCFAGGNLRCDDAGEDLASAVGPSASAAIKDDREYDEQ